MNYVGKRPALGLDEIEDVAIEMTRIASHTAAALAGHFAGAGDATTAARDPAHTVEQVEAGLITGDIGKETRRSVARTSGDQPKATRNSDLSGRGRYSA